MWAHQPPTSGALSVATATAKSLPLPLQRSQGFFCQTAFLITRRHNAYNALSIRCVRLWKRMFTRTVWNNKTCHALVKHQRVAEGLRKEKKNMSCLYCILYSLNPDWLFFELCEMVVLREACLFKSQSLGRLACWVGRWNLVCFYKQAFLSTKRVSLAGWSWGCAYTPDWIVKSCLGFFYATS